MPREKELYRDTLERIRGRADRLFPDKIIYTSSEASQIMGVSSATLWRHGIRNMTTAEQLARAFA